jgi:hypothetical protein
LICRLSRRARFSNFHIIDGHICCSFRHHHAAEPVAPRRRLSAIDEDQSAAVEQGQAFVEAGFALVIILGFTWAVIDAGALIWTYLTLENAVTEATRYAATQQTIGSLSRVDSIKETMRQMAPGITIADGEFSFQNITDGTSDPGGALDLIRITVTHSFRPWLPIPFPAFLASNPSGTFQIRVSSTVRNEPAPGA